MAPTPEVLVKARRRAVDEPVDLPHVRSDNWGSADFSRL
jgi:hypothetical protein